MIYVTGDTHGDWYMRFWEKNFPAGNSMTKDDYVIVLGDFGLRDWEFDSFYLNWLDKKPFTTLFVAGNHDNYDILDSLPVEEWHGGKVNKLRSSVIHLMRGQVYEIDGLKLFTFGGASSHDISDGILENSDPNFEEKKLELEQKAYPQYRIHHINWWARELPNEEEMDEGIKNLEIHGNKVDYILTHSPYTSILQQIQLRTEYYPDMLTDYLQRIKEKTEYKRWLFGHLHKNKLFFYDNACCLYEHMLKLYNGPMI